VKPQGRGVTVSYQREKEELLPELKRRNEKRFWASLQKPRQTNWGDVRKKKPRLNKVKRKKVQTIGCLAVFSN